MDSYTLEELQQAAEEIGRSDTANSILPQIVTQADKNRKVKGAGGYTEDQIRAALAKMMKEDGDHEVVTYGYYTSLPDFTTDFIRQLSGEFAVNGIYESKTGGIFRWRGDHWQSFGSENRLSPDVPSRPLTRIH